jgi:hypothetical protein
VRTRSVRNVLMAIMMAAATGATAVPAAAQGRPTPAAAPGRPAIDVSAGYSYLREQGTGSQPANIYDKGWVIAVACRLGRSRVAVVGEVGGSYRLDAFGERQSLYGLLGGVRVPVVHVWRFATFAQALVGEESFKQPGFKEHGMAFQPGAGIDLPLWGKSGVRVQGDYRLAHEEGINFKEARVTASVVIGMR